MIRTTTNATEAQEWALVLAAEQIPHHLESAGARFTLLVPDSDADRARQALDAFDEEAPGKPAAVVTEPAPEYRAWAVGVGVGALLLVFFAVTGPPVAGSPWFERGAAAAGAMVTREPWRAVTALTLHADAAHVAGNAVATAVLLPPIVQRLGPGYGLWLMLLAGTGANLVAALAHDPRHVAIGASTATFGAVGILGVLRFSAASRGETTRWKVWTVPVATLLLLVMLGTAQGADVLAHTLGFLSGGVLGLAAGALRRTPGPAIQWALVALAALVVVACWRLALAGTAR